jgi:predicted Zn-dependent protease
MSTELIDPWATPDPGFERYIGPDAADGFDPLDSRGKDLADYLRGELTARPQHQSTHETVILTNGTRAQLSQRSTDQWELLIHLGRDFYKVFTATTRRGALEAADADNRERFS